VSRSIGSSSRASGSRSSGAARRVGAVPSWRRIPDRTAATAPESHGLGWSWARCAAAIAAARRAIVTGRNSRSVSEARNAATVAGVAGIAARPRGAHHSANARQSLSYARLVAGASAEAAYEEARPSSRSIDGAGCERRSNDSAAVAANSCSPADGSASG
jgi:hypothetical protein